MTLSAILTNKLKPSADRRLSLCAMFWQKSFALVDESTSNAYKRKCDGQMIVKNKIVKIAYHI